MIVLAFILIILIGFLLFNPLKVNQDALSGQSNNSFAGFFIFCAVCIGFLCYYTMTGSADIIGKMSDNNSYPQNDIPKETPAETDNTKQEEQPQEEESPRGNYVDFDAFSSEKQLPIVEMSDYDGLTKKQLFALRKEIVNTFGGLGGKNYQPSEEIFGAIQDKKPWWGTEGILCKGQGNHASDGMSRESSYYNNPFILLNLGLGRVMNGNPGKEDCSGLWPKPTSLVVYPQEKMLKVEYDLSGFMKEFEGSAFYKSVQDTDWFEFASVNARDFGYTYAQAYEINGIEFANNPNVSTGARLRNYWCLGRSCQIEGGCNNICPSNDQFTFYVTSYPAYAKFRLYKTEPTSGSKPDAYFEVYLN